MACASCATGGCLTGGCNTKGGCSSAGCNRFNAFNWLSDIENPMGVEHDFDIVEVSFKQGAHKAYFRKPYTLQATQGDFVAVEAVGGGGYDIGHISLTGELMRLQLKRKRVKENSVFPNVLRIANERDMERLAEARSLEKPTLVKARAIARYLRLDMKIGDIEYQGDKRKATFYYTADGRVDFRELIRQFAKEFHVRIEMRQIGARQESARIGGLGPCGRELCCSTWLTDFKTVSTGAARYQNLSINQSKLSGQCGRLKCCLNFELDAYLEAFKEFPKNANRLQTKAGQAELIKTDIFRRMMYYGYKNQFSKIYALSIEKVNEILKMNANKEMPDELVDEGPAIRERSRRGGSAQDEEKDMGFADVTGEIELKPLERNKKKKKKRPTGNGTGEGSDPNRSTPQPRNENRPAQNRNQPQANRNQPPQQKPKDGNAPQQPPKQERPQAPKVENKNNQNTEDTTSNRPPLTPEEIQRRRNKNRNKKKKNNNGGTPPPPQPPKD